MAATHIETIEVPVRKLANHITCEIKVTGIKTWKFKLFLAKLLIRFAIWITGMNLNINDEEST